MALRCGWPTPGLSLTPPGTLCEPIQDFALSPAHRSVRQLEPLGEASDALQPAERGVAQPNPGEYLRTPENGLFHKTLLFAPSIFKMGENEAVTLWESAIRRTRVSGLSGEPNARTEGWGDHASSTRRDRRSALAAPVSLL
jgi:hypothetical protein